MVKGMYVLSNKLQIKYSKLITIRWWTETLSNRFTPKFGFAYYASFQDNKVLINNHHINPTLVNPFNYSATMYLQHFCSSYGNYKFWKGAHIVDLTTMKQSSAPYGSLFAHDYLVNCTSACDDDYFNWDTLEVINKKDKVESKISKQISSCLFDNILISKC